MIANVSKAQLVRQVQHDQDAIDALNGRLRDEPMDPRKLRSIVRELGDRHAALAAALNTLHAAGEREAVTETAEYKLFAVIADIAAVHGGVEVGGLHHDPSTHAATIRVRIGAAEAEARRGGRAGLARLLDDLDAVVYAGDTTAAIKMILNGVCDGSYRD